MYKNNVVVIFIEYSYLQSKITLTNIPNILNNLN